MSDGARREHAGERDGRAPVRALRRPVRAGDADAGAGRAGAGVAAGARGPRLPLRAGWAAARLRRAPDAAVSRGQALRAGRVARCISSARTSTTPARTSSTTRSVRRCWPSGWASGGSSPRPAPASTAWRPRPCARCWALSASSTWALEDTRRQRPNVQRMELLGASVAAGRRGRENAEGGDLGGDPRLGRRTSQTPTT